MGLRSRLRDLLPTRSTPISLEQWMSYFTFNGVTYPILGSTTLGEPQEEPEQTFQGYVQQAFKANGVIFACVVARQLLFSEARFQFRRMQSGRPGELFGDPSLKVLERPWPNGSTSTLLARAMQDTDLAGNFYAMRRGQTIKRLRPDWVTIVLGSELQPDDPGLGADVEVIGYIYQPGGPRGTGKPLVLLPEQVCHFAPIPDPLAHFRGMSWLTPVIREIMADNAATQHSLRYFEKGATPNVAVKGGPDLTPAKFREFVQIFKEHHRDLTDAYETIFLGGGADIEVIGSNMQQVEFKSTRGSGETRICMAARVPPIIIGASEGLQASTYSNYGQARRAFADLTMRPLWRDMARAFETVITVPPGAELWFDDRDISFLQEDVADGATILESNARSIRTLTDGGFDPPSVIDAVTAGDLKRLKHTGLLSVQMQPPGETAPANGNGSVPIGAPE